MSVGGVAPVEEVSVGGVAPVDVVGVVASEVLLSEKQGIVTVKMDPPKCMVTRTTFLEDLYSFDNKGPPGAYFAAKYSL